MTRSNRTINGRYLRRTRRPDTPRWRPCTIDPRDPGRYEMRHAGGNGYQAEVTWDGSCWYDKDGNAIQFYPLDPATHEWRAIEERKEHRNAS